MSTPDLYTCLSVDRGASPADIHTAYRRAAKRSHPDAGGSRDAFALVKLAADVLGDPQRRARYDATGDAAETTPDSTLSMALNLIAACLDGIVQSSSMEYIDVIAQIRQMLEQRVRQVRGQKQSLEKAAARWDKLAERFHRRGEGENLIAGVVRGKADYTRQMAARQETDLAANQRALELLKDYTFDAMQMQSQNGSLIWMNAIQPMWPR